MNILAACAFVYSAVGLLGLEFHYLPRALRSREAQDEEELARQVNDLFHDARHGGSSGGRW